MVYSFPMIQPNQDLTVHQVAQLTGVSVRTLHHYDQIGLLSPSKIGTSNGYRYYQKAALQRLQHILYFRELEFSLDEIKRMLDAPGFDYQQAYREHRRLLAAKRDRIDRLIATLDHYIYKEGTMADQSFDAFTDKDLSLLKDEAKKRWGNSEAWRQSQERTRHWTKADYDRIKQDGERFTAELATLVGQDPAAPQVQLMIAQHRQGINVFYDCSDEIYEGLARMYVEDSRFAAYYQRFHPDLPQFLHRAMLISLGKDPDAKHDR
jgi:DNA-binding transcriptional MerR regulator